jgi:hypothetical protein
MPEHIHLLLTEPEHANRGTHASAICLETSRNAERSGARRRNGLSDMARLCWDACWHPSKADAPLGHQDDYEPVRGRDDRRHARSKRESR